MMKIILFIFTFIIWQNSFSKEVRYLARSPKALLMGDAFTALADDEYTLFYNPAALGRGGMVEISPLNFQLGVVNALDEIDRFQDFPQGDYDGITERFMGFPINVSAGTVPTLKIGSLGISLLAQSSMTIVLRNSVHPVFDIDYRFDRGFVAGFAYDLLGNGGKKRGTGKYKLYDMRFSIGASVKHINRQGMDIGYDLYDTTLVNIVSSTESDPRVLREALGYSRGDAWGADIGAEFGFSLGESQFLAGFAISDIGDTRFKKEAGVYDVPVQDMYMSAGISWQQDFWLVDYSLSADIHPINENIVFGRKLHLGARIGFPVIDFYAGLNAGYLSYGVELDFWPFRLTAGFYDVEVGATYKQEKNKRAILYLSLFDLSIDG